MPGCWAMTEAPSGTSAWRRLLAGMSRPREPNMARILASMASSRIRATPMTSAITSRVMSSWVGPRPPQTMTASARSSACSRAVWIRARLSPTLAW